MVRTEGEAFSFVNKEKSLEKILLKWLEKGTVSLADRQNIAEWTRYSISGDSVAAYFEKKFVLAYQVIVHIMRS